MTEISDDEVEFVEIGPVPRPTQRALEYSVATATDAGAREPRVPMCLAYVLDQCTSPPIPPDGQNKLKPKPKKRPLHWVCISSTIMQTTITLACNTWHRH